MVGLGLGYAFIAIIALYIWLLSSKNEVLRSLGVALGGTFILILLVMGYFDTILLDNGLPLPDDLVRESYDFLMAMLKYTTVSWTVFFYGRAAFIYFRD